MSSLALRILACVCMLCDHIGYAFAGRYPALQVLRWIGRCAFPLYAFLIAEGYKHTSSRLRYTLRLAVFAVLSQIPYALFLQQAGFWQSFNVFFTLLLSLLTIWATDELRKRGKLKYIAVLPTLCVAVLYYFGLLRSDYGLRGILLAMAFYLFPNRSWLLLPSMLLATYCSQLLSLGVACLDVLRGRAFVFSGFSKWDYTQLLSLLALIPIGLYNGERGRLPQNRLAAKSIQLGFYLFYPAHQLLLWWLRGVILEAL